MIAPSASTPTTTHAGSVVLLPGDKFFVRRIALTPGQDVPSQVELAFETLAPFAAPQLFHGYCPSRDGAQALIFAAYRKNFSPDEISLWATADAVLPDFALWLGLEKVPGAEIWIRESDRAVEAVAWDGTSDLPAGILFRKTDALPAATVAEQLKADLGRRFDLADGGLDEWTGDVAVKEWTKEGLVLRLDNHTTALETRLSLERVRLMDVRDKSELAERSQLQRRDLWLWRAFVAVAAGLALCVLAELVMLGAGRLLAGKRSERDANAPAVQQISQANDLSARMEQIATQRLMPFEMLVVLNNIKPHSLQFVRVSTVGVLEMDVEAQTPNASDLRDYEQSLNKVPAIEKVEMRDPHTRENMTTFLIQVTFKREFLRAGGAK